MRAVILEHGPRVRRLVLLGMIAAIPLVIVRMVNDPINVPKLTLLMVGTTVVAAIRAAELTQGASRGGLDRMALPGLFLAAPLLLAWLVNPHRGWTLFGEYGRFQGLVPYLVFIAFGVLVADAFAGQTRPLLWAVAAAGGVAGGLALLQRLGIDPVPGYAGSPYERAAVSTFGNTNFAGGVLAIALPVTLVLAATERPRRTLAWAGAAATAAGLAASISQGAWAAGVAGVAVGAGFWLAPRWRLARVAGVAVGALVLGAVVGSVLVSALRPGLDLHRNVEVRSDLWRSAVAIGLDAPIAGRGPNAFAYLLPQYRSPQDLELSAYADDPHSVPLSLFANAGVLGAIGYLALVVWTVRRAAAPGRGRGETAAFAGALAAYLVQSLVSIDELALRLLFWTALGGLVAATSEPEATANLATGKRGGKGPRSGKGKGKGKGRSQGTQGRSAPLAGVLQRPIALGAAGVVAAGLLYWQVGFLVADRRAVTARSLARTDASGAYEQVERALGFRDEYEYRHVVGFDLGRAAVAEKQLGADDMERVAELFSYVDRFPDVPAMLDYGRVLGAWSQYDPDAAADSAAAFVRAIELDPYNPALRVDAAIALSLAGRNEEAERFLLSYLYEVDGGNATVWGRLALVRVALEDFDGARVAVDRALSLDPEQAAARRADRALSGGGRLRP
ncbi:MAG: O-antigen ligase family protein [Actinomycetota bacterium]